MGYWMETAKDGDYLGDIATIGGMLELRKMADLPAAVRTMLETGEAKASELPAIIEACQGLPALRYIADLLDGVEDGVLITDGVG